MIKEINQNITYPIALLMSTSAKKNFESLGRDMSISGDAISKILTTNAVTMHNLIDFCKTVFAASKSLYLIIDDTLISKIYSRVIEGVCDNYSSSDRQQKRSICSVVAMITDGETAIPIDQSIWVSSEYNPSNYKKKWEIARELILRITPVIKIKKAIMDGLFAIPEFMKWLTKNNIKFEMRFHANRVIECKGIKAPIKNHPRFKVKMRNPRRTLKVLWHGLELYATVFKRLMKNGNFSIVFQISNYKASAREHVQTYKYRWNIEKFFRTAKQKLGLNDCLARKQETQEQHLMNVFLSYAIAQAERIKLKLKNVESAIKSLKRLNSDQLKNRFNPFLQIFCHA